MKLQLNRVFGKCSEYVINVKYKRVNIKSIFVNELNVTENLFRGFI